MPETNSHSFDSHSLTAAQVENQEAPTAVHEPPRAYTYPHADDHPPVAPVPEAQKDEVKSYGGAPEGGT